MLIDEVLPKYDFNETHSIDLESAATARAAWNFFVDPISPTRSVLRTETRILCSDAASRRRFGFYWKIIRPGSGIIRHAILAAVKDEARRASQLPRS